MALVDPTYYVLQDRCDMFLPTSSLRLNPKYTEAGEFPRNEIDHLVAVLFFGGSCVRGGGGDVLHIPILLSA